MSKHWLMNLPPTVGKERDPEKVDEEMGVMEQEIELLRFALNKSRDTLRKCRSLFQDIIELDPYSAKGIARAGRKEIDESLAGKK